MTDSRLFVVRIWSDANRFRASARAVEQEQTRFFDEPESLLRFLAGGELTESTAERGPVKPAPALPQQPA